MGIDTKKAIIKTYKVSIVKMILFQCILISFFIPRTRFGVLEIAVYLCIVAYLFIFRIYFAIFPRKKFKRFWIPYLIYALGVYLNIVMERDWYFSIVTIDSCMRLGWFIPIYGLIIYTIVFLYYYISLKRRLLIIARSIFSGRIFINHNNKLK